MRSPSPPTRVPGVALALGLATVLASCSASRETALPPEVPTNGIGAALASSLADQRRRVLEKPGDAHAWSELAKALDAAELQEAAAACYRQALRILPSSAEWHHLLGINLLPRHLDQGLHHLEQAIRLDRPDADASAVRRLLALAEAGRVPEAEAQANALLARHPGHPLAHLELARIRTGQGRLEEARPLLEAALTNAFTARPALQLLAQIHLRSGDPVRAAEAQRRAGALPRPFEWPDPHARGRPATPANPGALLEEVNRLLEAGRLEEAAGQLAGIESRHGETLESRLLLGRLKILERRCAEARQILTVAAQSATNHLQVHVQLGLAQFCDGRWQDAARSFATATRLKPDFAQAHYNLALALQRLGQADRAVESLRQALACSPGDPSTHAALAECLLETGRRDEAQFHLARALDIAPTHPKANRLKARFSTPPAR